MRNYFIIPGTPQGNPPDCMAFINAFCKVRRVVLSEIQTKSRENEHVVERQIIMYLLCMNYTASASGSIPKKLRVSKGTIAAFFNRDHSTVCHSEGIVSGLLFVDKNFKKEIEEICKKMSIELGIAVKYQQ